MAEKLENINLQLARRKQLRRRVVIGLLAVICTAIMITFAMLIILDSSYLAWDYQKPETAVVGVAFHAFEWLFVRAAPIMLVTALGGLWLARKFL